MRGSTRQSRWSWEWPRPLGLDCDTLMMGPKSLQEHAPTRWENSATLDFIDMVTARRKNITSWNFCPYACIRVRPIPLKRLPLERNLPVHLYTQIASPFPCNQCLEPTFEQHLVSPYGLCTQGWHHTMCCTAWAAPSACNAVCPDNVPKNLWASTCHILHNNFTHNLWTSHVRSQWKAAHTPTKCPALALNLSQQ
jgi:hypothetical protein